jgi:hypothetical protein
LADTLQRIDDGIFRLFDVSVPERALVTDFHRYLLGLAGTGAEQYGSERMPPLSRTYGGLADAPKIAIEPMRSYVTAFLQVWDRQLAPEDTALSWTVDIAPQRDLVAVVFETFAGDLPPQSSAPASWDEVLARVSNARRSDPIGSILSEDVIRIVSDTSIIVMKPNRPRYWSASAAMEDAEATLLQAMNLKT